MFFTGRYPIKNFNNRFDRKSIKQTENDVCLTFLLMIIDSFIYLFFIHMYIFEHNTKKSALAYLQNTSNKML